MTAFISYSFQNRPEFENVVDALERQEVPYWNPSGIKPGASLREQLRSAVERCDLCIFVATRDSVKSSWCGAELGAFWGAGKPVVVYLAEASLAEDELPPIVRGDVWERRILKVAERAREIIGQARQSGAGKASHRVTPVTQLTVEQLENLIVSAMSLAAASAKDHATPPSLQAVETAVKDVAGKVLVGFHAGEAIATDVGDGWHRKILWVDDRPDNNVHERRAMAALAGIEFTLALSTKEALTILAARRFAAIISDMGRKEGSREGYVLLEAVRANDQATPFFIYAGSNAPQHKREAALRGAQGTTNDPAELLEMVINALPRSPL